jgi:hypothetical protein
MRSDEAQRRCDLTKRSCMPRSVSPCTSSHCMLIAAPPCMLSAAPPCMQVPAEKRVYVHDEGKNDLGLARSWYRVAPVPPPSPP